MSHQPHTTGRLVGRRSVLATGAAATLAVAGALIPGQANAAPSATASPQRTPRQPLPSIVLVHGAFADGSSWNAVASLLLARGYTVYSPPNPLRGIFSDADYLRAYLSTIPGQVTLVGHSYGGAVITNAAVGSPGVKSLVYVAAYALAEGETIAAANELGGGTSLLGQHIQVRPFPGAAPGDVDAYIDPDHFREVFAQDLPRHTTALMAVAQRPLAASALGTPSGPPAWSRLPSWYLIAADDHAIPPEAEQAMAKRARARTVKVSSSHAAMLSHPVAVAELIVAASKGH